MSANSRRTFAGAAVALAVVAAGSVVQVGPAQATDRGSTVVVGTDSPGRATLVRSEQSMDRYDDEQVLEFLVLGEGEIAKDHPRLGAQLGFAEPSDQVDRAAAHKLMSDYLAATPSFHGQVAVPLQNGDPQKVDAALQRFATSFNGFIENLYQQEMVKPGDQMSTQGWVWTSTWAVTAGWALAAAGAVVYGAVAGFHAGVAVTVIVYVYLPGMEGAPTTIERDTMVHALSTALDG